MNKIEFIKVLCDKGYNALLEDNVVKVHLECKSRREVNKDVYDIIKLKQEHGYNASIGWKAIVNNGLNRRRITEGEEVTT